MTIEITNDQQAQAARLRDIEEVARDYNQISGNAARELIAEVRRLRECIASVRHKGHCATVKYACKGIEIEKGVFLGCGGGKDCPECEGVKKPCTCGIETWQREALGE